MMLRPLCAMAGTSRAVVRAVTIILTAMSVSLPAGGSPQEPGQALQTHASHLSQAALLALDDNALRSLIETDPDSLGTLSIGTPSGGILLNGTVMPDGPGWQVRLPAEALGTAETLAFIRAAIDKVNEIFPGSPPLAIGDISDAQGGRLNRHISHQTGRDADLGFYYKNGSGVWHIAGTAANLDLPRNWALVRALLLCTDVETILLDSRIQRLLYAHALKIGEDKAWLDRVFRFVKGAKEARIVHTTGHRTHYHVRFYNPIAQELGRRAYPHLVRLNRIKPPVFTVSHTVREGQTLGHIARRYGVSVGAIQRYNGLPSTLIRAGRTYRVPLKGVAAPLPGPLVFPFRMLAFRTPEALAAVKWPTPVDLYGDALSQLARTPLLAGGTALPL
jgi:LysM repeat protein